jgi:hypothetical protein
MSKEARYFVLQARDPDHGCPVFEARFPVTELDELRVLAGIDPDDDPEFEGSYTLDAAETEAITARFGVAFDAEGREVHLWPWDEQWDKMRRIPYLVHGGYELALLLEGRKQLARFLDVYPPDRHFDEDRFDRYVAEGILHKEIVVEPFAEPDRRKDGRVLEGHRSVYYSRKGEEWRIQASKLIWGNTKCGWNEDFERMEGLLFGYEAWQNDWWIADIRRRRYRFGCLSIYRAISADDLTWIEAAGYRALPPTKDSALAVSSLWDPPDEDAARRMTESAGADALVHLNVRAMYFLDLVKGQSGPDHMIPAARIRDLNRNIEGHIEVVAMRAEAAPEPTGSHLQETRPPQ